MDVSLRLADASELQAIAQLVAGFQRSPETAIAFFGDTPAEVAAEIEGWGESWPTRCLVGERGGDLVAFCALDLDAETQRAWLYGPFATAPEWDTLADRLVKRLETTAADAGIHDLELAGDVRNVLLDELAARHGFARGRPSYALEIDAAAVAALPPPSVPFLRPTEHAQFVELHDALFPGTYYSGAQLLAQGQRGEATILGLVEEGRLTGYAAGRIDSAGEGYLDFMGVAEDARGAGRGGRLVASFCRLIVEEGDCSKVALTVYEDNVPALALYDRLGFTRRASLVGYRRRPQ